MTEHWTFSNDPFMPDGEPVPGQTYRADGWAYKDLPKLSYEHFDRFLEIVGAGNFAFLSFADYGDSKRGQILISPKGLLNLTAEHERMQK